MSRADVRCLSLLTVGLLVAVAGCHEQGDPRVTYAVPLVLQETSQSSPSAGPGEPVRLGITVSATAEEALSFVWSTTAGSVSTSVDAAGRSEVVWTALSCLAPGVTPTVTVTVTDSAGLSVSHTFTVTWTGPVCTRAPCLFSLGDGRVALMADCTTDSTLLIPDDYTFDGQGHTVTAVDPPGGTFTGAVLRNRGPRARVRDVTVTASGLRDGCKAGAARLRGILLEGASGEVVDSEVRNLQKGAGASGCQEGFGIEVRNEDASRGPFRVDVLRNRVTGYQKTGLLAVGTVDVTFSGNTVEGGGPVTHIARNGLQVSLGARGRVTGNNISGNAYTGPVADTFGAGLVVTGGSYFGPDSPLVKDLVVEGNTLTDNDVGVSLSQLDGTPAVPAPPAIPTRIRVAGNILSNRSASNPYYQAAIADYGTANILTSNIISGAGYDPAATEPRRTFAVDVWVGAVTKLAFLTAPHDVAVGACSGKLTVQSQDANGNLVPTAGTFTLEATGPAALTFFADPGCTGGALSTVSLSNPQAEANFYFKATTPGAVTVSVSGEGLSPASQAHTVH